MGKIEDAIWKMAEPLVEENGMELLDVEYVKEGSDWYLRAYIDKEEGVNIGDCENVSRAFSDALDEADFIEDAYILEVSSPGLGRTLKKDKHLEKSLGEEVEIKLLNNAIDHLNPREKKIVELRFGLKRSDGAEMTQKEVADLMGISQSYISRLEKKIMKRLRKEIVRYE